jgi:hypothetical protein
LFSHHELIDIIATNGYWIVVLAIGLECLGLPLPGESILIAAAIYAGSSHALNIWLVIGAAAFGAILGNTIGFWIGREGGYRLLLRYGRRFGMTDDRIKLGQYLFLRSSSLVALSPCCACLWRFLLVQTNELAFFSVFQCRGLNCLGNTLRCGSLLFGREVAPLYSVCRDWFGGSGRHFNCRCHDFPPTAGDPITKRSRTSTAWAVEDPVAKSGPTLKAKTSRSKFGRTCWTSRCPAA